MEQQTTPQTSGSARPFKYYGKQGELTLIAPLKPGGAERFREILRRSTDTTRQPPRGDLAELIGTLHEIRVTLIDNDTRMLFATVYDGTWDQYINDFVANPGTFAALEELWQTLEGFPGMQSPEVKDYLVKYQVPVAYFWTAYPDSTVNRIKKGEQVLSGFEKILDSAG